MSEKLALLEVRGDHRQVGRQIGAAMRPVLQALLPRLRRGLPDGVRWEDMLHQGRDYLAHSRAVYPQYVQEIEGIAEGSGLPFEELFLEVCEELWEPAAWGQRGRADRSRRRGCTDLAARGRATADGSTLIGHTNDLVPESEDELVILKVRAGDEPEFLAVSWGGVGLSAGFNAAGISLSGNAVSCTDIRPGVPRLLLVRAILAARRLGQAIDVCLLPQRASNYNNVIADAHGEVFSVEGSATDYEAIYIEQDVLAHANHYASPAMRAFEADRSDIGGSILRQHRAARLLREHYGELTPLLMQQLLADHANYPASICKHAGESVTVFSMVVQVEGRRAWIGRGRPCQSEYVEYRLEPGETEQRRIVG
ncbi:MAG: hypothetical protein JXA37_00755 [Chloroflexia bacterium]|nr:hypothetical protein [Chloroflexia bacterium]